MIARAYQRLRQNVARRYAGAATVKRITYLVLRSDEIRITKEPYEEGKNARPSKLSTK